MQMTFRWFGNDKDTVTLEQIKQIPGVTGIVPALHYLLKQEKCGPLRTLPQCVTK